jgi:uncharacterized membrane protein
MLSTPTKIDVTQRTNGKAAPVTPDKPAKSKNRLTGIDALRGLALCFMFLRHTAFFIGGPLQAETYGGQPAALQSWPHWVTGLVANMNTPTFWLLFGVSVALLAAGRRKQGASEWEITRYLLIRAGVLLTLDLTICEWFWDVPGPQVHYTHVLLSIAISMSILSVARLLPLRVFAALVVALMLGYQAFLPYIAANFSNTLNPVTTLLLGYSTQFRPNLEFALFGWFPVAGLGFILGNYASSPTLRKPRAWLLISGALFALWLGLRWWGGFGDLTPRGPDDPLVFFFIMSKTPLALTYLCFYLGISMLIMAGFVALGERLERAPFQWLINLGQVSLFAFVAHIVIYGILSFIAKQFAWPVPRIAESFAVWAAGLAILFPLAYHYNRLRRSHPNSLLRYL